MLLFLFASGIGIYALGNGWTGLSEPGHGASLLWLAVAGGAIMILFWQMGRVHDTWPRRRDTEAPPRLTVKTRNGAQAATTRNPRTGKG